jgi:four helix bundle protein
VGIASRKRIGDGKAQVNIMRLRIYSVALEIVALVARLALEVKRHDPDLARQMKKASTSVALNLAEGEYSRGGNQLARFQDAMASANETVACVEASIAAEYIRAGEQVELLDKLDHVVATTWTLIRRR